MSEAPTPTLPTPDYIVRPLEGRMISGVCAGIAARFSVPVILVRVLFIFPGMFFLSGPILYAALTFKIDEWPGQAHLAHLGEADSMPADYDEKVESAKKWRLRFFGFLAGLVLCVIAAYNSEDATSLLDLCAIVCLVGTIVTGYLALLARGRVKQAELSVARRRDMR